MAFLNVVYCNHMDLTWRRPRYSAGVTDGYNIAPYLEIQERQIDAGLDFIRSGGKYDLEQTICLRDYLERNPDLFDEVCDMIRDGKLTILGGGESVVDYNLSDGESIVRNHLYSRRWLRETFGVTPTLAACPDTFGLSAGLPGLFRQLGYRGLSMFHRVFVNNKPYWKGLSGDVVALDSARLQYNMAAEQASSFRKSRVCTLCGGKGCDACGGMGLEFINDPATGEGYDRFAESVKQAEGDVTIWHLSEEGSVPKDAVKGLEALADKTGRTLRFLSMEEMCNTYAGDLLARVDEATEDEIDERVEGNPVAAGCYTARIRIKQEVRLCEALLRAAERLAVAASLEGEKYPAKTLEYWWKKLHFLQFHDSVPGSHSDDANAELMEYGRRLHSGVGRIIDRSTKKLLEKIRVESGEGIPFVVFNPLEFDVDNVRLTGVMHCDKLYENGRVVGPDGGECAVLGVRHTNTPDCNHAAVEFIGSLPAFGYAVYRFIPEEADLPQMQPVKNGCVMENEFMRVEFGRYNVLSVYDKVRGCEIATEGTFAPLLTDDAGHLWGRSNAIAYAERADLPDHCDDMLPAPVFERAVSAMKGDGFQRVDVSIRYARHERQVKMLDWTAEFLLPDNAKELHVRIRTKFDARDIKLSTQVVLPKAPVGGLMDCEIPLGVVGRGPVDAFDPFLEHSDEWAALRYVSADLGDARVTLCNSGTPGHSIDGNAIRVSLLRNPTLLCCAFGIGNAIDPTENVFDFTLAADDSLQDAYRRGMKLNSRFPAAYAAPQDGELPQTGQLMSLPNEAILMGLKGAEDGEGYVLRYLGGEDAAKLAFGAPVTPGNLLEDVQGEAVQAVEVPRYTIATYRAGAEVLKK